MTFPFCLNSMFWDREKQFLPLGLSLVQVKSEFGTGELGYTEVHIQMPTEHNTLNLISLPTTKRKLFFIKNLANIPMVQTAEGSYESWWLSWDDFITWICILNTWMVLKESGAYGSVLPLLKLVPNFTLEMR